MFLEKIKKIFHKVLKSGDCFKKSYSQSGEDLIIKFIFDTIGVLQPSYIDIGAHDPFYLSNTALFYETGSTGVSVEPDPYLFKKIKKKRKRDINLNLGIGLENCDQDFYIMNVPTLNTFSKIEAERALTQGDYSIDKVITVPVKSLKCIIDQHCKGFFPDFLSVDVEGIDELIIKSIDFESNSPKVICVETISFSNNGEGVKDNNLIKFIESKGYLLYADTFINTIFVKKDLWHKCLIL